MRTTDQQIDEILKRFDKFKQQKHTRKLILVDGISVFVCLTLISLSVIFRPDPSDLTETAVRSDYGSLILGSSGLGYVVIGLLSFILGILVTLLCIHIRRYYDNKR